MKGQILVLISFNVRHISQRRKKRYMNQFGLINDSDNYFGLDLDKNPITNFKLIYLDYIFCSRESN